MNLRQYPADRIRNVGLFGHGGAGKTSLAEALLFDTKATTRLGRVEEGNTVADYDPDEIKRASRSAPRWPPWSGTRRRSTSSTRPATPTSLATSNPRCASPMQP